MFRTRVQLATQFIGWLTILVLAGYGGLAFLGLDQVWLARAEAEAATAWNAPGMMTYQGIVKDASGAPLSGEHTMSFYIYDGPDPASSTIIWGPETKTVTVVDGYFSVLLGEETALTASIFNNTQRYIAVEVDTYGEMLPRQRITSAPYALVAYRADNSTSAGTANTLVENAVHQTVQGLTSNGDVTVNGDLRIAPGGMCIDSDTSCASPGDGGLRVGPAGIQGTNMSETHVFLVPGSGNVGIGTTTPAYKLDVNGDINWSGHLQGLKVTWFDVIENYNQAQVVQKLEGMTTTNSICTLHTFVSITMDRTTSACAFRDYDSDGIWELLAQNQGVYPNQTTRCGAWCLSW